MQSVRTKRRFLFKRRYVWLAALFILSGAIGFGYLRYSQPVGSPTTQTLLHIEQTTGTPTIPWPAAQASIGTVQDGVLASKPNQTVRPTASTAKLITVLTVLEKKPLAVGQTGPVLTIDQSDINLYSNYVAANGSVVAVRLGEKMSQYQMIQGILIRSGNNLADSLAIWAFGSLSAYQKAAQEYVDSLGMKNTTVGTDASGLSPTTTSTAEDLTLLGIAAMKHEVVREVVRQTSSNFPNDGQRPNTNWLLGTNGVVGIKTGNLPAVGGVFIIAREFTPEGQNPITLVGAVQGAPTGYAAIEQAGQLAADVEPFFSERAIAKKGDIIANITTPWGESSQAKAESDAAIFGWVGLEATPDITIDTPPSFNAGDIIGTIKVGDHSSNLVATDTIHGPSWWWRVTASR